MEPEQAAAQRLGQIEKHFSGSAGSTIRNVYIISAARTPTAKFNGSFKTVPAPRLGAAAIKAAFTKSNVPVEHIRDVYMGNVLQANEGQAPARQAMLFAGLPSTTDAVTVNKVCSSGLKAVMLAAQNIQLGLADAEIAGGMESMTRVPYYVPRASLNPSFGSMEMQDGLIGDGLWDVYKQFHMGNCAEHSAKQFNISRKEQDEFAIRSFKRAQRAWKEGKFDEEITPVTVDGKNGQSVKVAEDQGYLSLNEEKIPNLPPAFLKDGTGTITAANASSMNDGASAMVLVNADLAAQYGKSSRVLSKIVSYADAAVDPIDFSIAPAKAIKIALQRANLQVKDIALWEINEAFASVVKITEKLVGLDDNKVNVLGGAISLGHALGSSGSRILTTLLHQLKVGEYGAVALCNGGGAASAMIIRRVDSSL
ncbi:hypothetical protein V492_02764 [Pseudogymnoascus sp. VKM F-4246]|nr:hypothetical protein V492_02764 [Pseudogymnoascus sp. VKM F-4246]